MDYALQNHVTFLGKSNSFDNMDYALQNHVNFLWKTNSFDDMDYALQNHVNFLGHVAVLTTWFCVSNARQFPRKTTKFDLGAQENDKV